MSTIKVSQGKLMVRPTGRVLATSCGGGQHCSPCIVVAQNAAQVVLANGPCPEFWRCGLVDMLPGSLGFCESWEQPTWAGDCCWVWADRVDISDIVGVPGWIFNYVLIIRWAPNGCFLEFQNNETDNWRPPGFSGEIYCGSDIEDGDPCTWMVGADPLFVSTASTQNTIQCGQDGKLHGILGMEGRVSGWGGADATGYTSTITLP